MSRSPTVDITCYRRFRPDRLPPWASVSLHPPPSSLLSPSQHQHRSSSTSYFHLSYTFLSVYFVPVLSDPPPHPSKSRTMNNNHASSPRSCQSISEHRRSALAGLNNNSTLGESAVGDASLPPSDPRSSSRPRTSNGDSPILATTGDPHHHHRTPSLGELHQELEQEQEAQVVSLGPRLLRSPIQSPIVYRYP